MDGGVRIVITITQAEYQLMRSVSDPDRQSKLFEVEMVILAGLAQKIKMGVEKNEIKVKG